MYNLRTPTVEESRLVVASGKEMEIELIGDLDIVLHCDEDVVVTLRDVAYIPGLWGELISFNVIQDHRTICLLYTSPSPRDQRGSRMPSSA